MPRNLSSTLGVYCTPDSFPPTFVFRLSIACLISSQPPAACFTIHPTSPVALPSASGISECVMHFCAGTAYPTEVLLCSRRSVQVQSAKAGAARDGSDVGLLALWRVVERRPQVHRKWITRLLHKFSVFKSVLFASNSSHALVCRLSFLILFSPDLKTTQEPMGLDCAKEVGLFE